MKAERQRKIIELITEKNIETQEQLLDELHRSGFKSTQATVSRDIKELQRAGRCGNDDAVSAEAHHFHAVAADA